MCTRNPGVYPIFQPCSPFKTAYQVSRQPTCRSSQFVARTTGPGKLWTHPLGLQFVTRTSEAGQGTTITATCNVRNSIPMLSVSSNPTYCWICKSANVYDMTYYQQFMIIVLTILKYSFSVRNKKQFVQNSLQTNSQHNFQYRQESFHMLYKQQHSIMTVEWVRSHILQWNKRQ